MKNRIFLCPFQPEANSFAGVLTTMEDFRKRGLRFGSKNIEIKPGNNSTISGFFDVLSEREDVTML